MCIHMHTDLRISYQEQGHLVLEHVQGLHMDHSCLEITKNIYTINYYYYYNNAEIIQILELVLMNLMSMF